MALQTRWADNDAYGHLNNATYLSLFDTALTEWQVTTGFLTPEARFLVVATHCSYHAELAYPDALTCAVACDHIGNSSCRFSMALFKAGEDHAATTAEITQVAVDPMARAKRPLTSDERLLLLEIAPTSGRPQAL